VLENRLLRRVWGPEREGHLSLGKLPNEELIISYLKLDILR
jgi:hypothetical protein